MKFSNIIEKLKKKYKLTSERTGLQFGYQSPRARISEILSGKYDQNGPSNQVSLLMYYVDKYGPLPDSLIKKIIDKSRWTSNTITNGNQKATEKR